MPTQTILNEMRTVADIPELGSISVNKRLSQSEKVADYIERGGNLCKAKHTSNRGIEIKSTSTYATSGTLTECLKTFFENC
jgi:hypothetical protein